MAPPGDESRAHRIVKQAVREVMREEEMSGEQTVDLQLAGQKVKISGHDVNLIVTVLSAIGIALLVWIAVGHQQDAREASAAFVAAIKEQTIAQREQITVMREANCLQSYQGPAPEKASFCKQVTR